MTERTADICGCVISSDYQVFGMGRCLSCHQQYLFEKCNAMVVSCDDCFARLQEKKRRVWDEFQLELDTRRGRK